MVYLVLDTIRDHQSLLWDKVRVSELIKSILQHGSSGKLRYVERVQGGRGYEMKTIQSSSIFGECKSMDNTIGGALWTMFYSLNRNN